MRLAGVMALCVGVACGCGNPGRSDEAKKPPEPATSDAWTRAEWLAAAEGFAADPATPVFERLVSTQAWLKVDRTTFEQSSQEVIRFFPTWKKVALALISRGAVDQLVALGLYGLEVYRAIIGAATDFIDHLPADDATRATRLGGIEKMRLGAAMEVCALLYFVIEAAQDRRDAAIAKLTSSRSYAFHSRDGLQLIIATLDERLLPNIGATLRSSYERIREVVAGEHAKRAATSSARTTYQGLGPPSLDPSVGSVVSRTGGFAVDIGPTALAKQVEVRKLDGTTTMQHWIELQDGETHFESACFDDKSESELVARFGAATGASEVASKSSGTWLTFQSVGKEGRARILTVSGRGCLASVEGPRGSFTEARADAFLASLRPAP